MVAHRLRVALEEIGSVFSSAHECIWMGSVFWGDFRAGKHSNIGQRMYSVRLRHAFGGVGDPIARCLELGF